MPAANRATNAVLPRAGEATEAGSRTIIIVICVNCHCFRRSQIELFQVYTIYPRSVTTMLSHRVSNFDLLKTGKNRTHFHYIRLKQSTSGQIKTAQMRK